MLKKYVVSSLVFLFSISLGSFVYAASQKGIFITYESNSENSWSQAEEDLLKDHKCTLQRSGMLNKGFTLGKLSWASADHFKVMACDGLVLGKLIESGEYEKLNQKVANLRIVEGKLKQVSHEQPPTSANYIIKVSNFNNIFSKTRKKQLKSINKEAQALEHGYIEDMVFHPVSAKGITPPDRVTFLYYQSEAEGEKFRQNNLDMLKRIQAFNQTHLTEFVYVLGSDIH